GSRPCATTSCRPAASCRRSSAAATRSIAVLPAEAESRRRDIGRSRRSLDAGLCAGPNRQARAARRTTEIQEVMMSDDNAMRRDGCLTVEPLLSSYAGGGLDEAGGGRGVRGQLVGGGGCS